MRLTSKFCLLLALTFLAGCNGEIRDFSHQEFQKGATVGIHNPNSDRDVIDVKTSTGVNAKVIFSAHTSLSIKFEDEKADRKISDAGWIIASEIRQIREQDLLYIKVISSNLTRYNEWQNDSRIFVYKLSTRKLMGWARNA